MSEAGNGGLLAVTLGTGAGGVVGVAGLADVPGPADGEGATDGAGLRVQAAVARTVPAMTSVTATQINRRLMPFTMTPESLDREGPFVTARTGGRRCR